MHRDPVPNPRKSKAGKDQKGGMKTKKKQSPNTAHGPRNAAREVEILENVDVSDYYVLRLLNISVQ